MCNMASINFHIVVPVSIISHPVNLTVNGTEKAIISVEAMGNGLTYQWKKNGSNLTVIAGKLEGVNTPTLTVLDAQVGDEGFYSCEVTNRAGDNVTSDEAFLHTVGKYHYVTMSNFIYCVHVRYLY